MTDQRARIVALASKRNQRRIRQSDTVGTRVIGVRAVASGIAAPLIGPAANVHVWVTMTENGARIALPGTRR